MVTDQDKVALDKIVADMRVVSLERKKLLNQKQPGNVSPVIVQITKQDLRELTGRKIIRDKFQLEVVAYFKSLLGIMAEMEFARFQGEQTILVWLVDPVTLRRHYTVAELKESVK